MIRKPLKPKRMQLAILLVLLIGVIVGMVFLNRYVSSKSTTTSKDIPTKKVSADTSTDTTNYFVEFLN